MINWPRSVHDARIFSNSKLNTMFREGVVPDCSKIIVEGKLPIPICILGDPAYLLLPYIMKEFANGGKKVEEQFFGCRLSSTRMVTECVFGRLETRFGCLGRDMDINLDDLMYIHSCFIFHKFCEIYKEPVHPQYVTAALKYDSQFQVSTHGGYTLFFISNTFISNAKLKFAKKLSKS